MQVYYDASLDDTYQSYNNMPYGLEGIGLIWLATRRI